MKTRTLVLAALAAAVLGTATLAARSGDGPPIRPDTEGLVIHEWGTFTSVQGSDGVGLEGLHHEEEALPWFVYDRAAVRECPLRDRGYKGLEVPVTSVMQKMETPVIYVHTATKRRIRLRVDFVDGLLTQWYPVVDRLGPPEGAVKDGPLDLRTVKRSFLEWEFEALPRTGEAPDRIPGVDAGDPWAFAREVDAAWLRTTPREDAGRSGPVEAEHYLFYRGLGTFDLPVTVKALPGGSHELQNATGHPLTAAFVLDMWEKRARMLALGAVTAGDPVVFDLAGEPAGEKAAVVETLRAKVKEALLAGGLFADEAEAMVKTWARQWFASEGTRVIYLVPRAFTDRILPMRISPKPDSLVRVLVGRLEFLAPETEAEVARALRNRTSEDPGVRAAAESRLARLGRFLEPHLRRVAATDPALRDAADEALEESVR